jgi:hypothetical protein
MISERNRFRTYEIKYKYHVKIDNSIYMSELLDHAISLYNMPRPKKTNPVCFDDLDGRTENMTYINKISAFQRTNLHVLAK